MKEVYMKCGVDFKHKQVRGSYLHLISNTISNFQNFQKLFHLFQTPYMKCGVDFKHKQVRGILQVHETIA